MTAKAHCHCEERSDQRQGEGFDALAKMLNIVRLALIQALIVPLGIVRIEGNRRDHPANESRGGRTVQDSRLRPMTWAPGSVFSEKNDAGSE